MADVAALVADLAAEGAALDALVAELPGPQWARPTPAAGWTVAHQIGHLAWTDEVATLAATDPARFRQVVDGAEQDAYGVVDAAAEERAGVPPAQLLATWRAGRVALGEALLAVPAGERLLWFGPPMSAASMATARLMETWAHGLDVADALGAPTAASERLKHVAHLGVRTRDFAYLIRGEQPPPSPFRVELTGPSGTVWTWGPEGAGQKVSGPALDFCLLVTQRRARADLQLVASGADADRWLDIAQAFAGPPGAGRAAALAPQ
ncbi:TIGR03084 family metal-binding protein [uncultured Jatrophihabitans sp.]|uniref:TIGR03084 family metal-binding protein n=1 Tax=uncultured Jatrophihabitans sp. TaxID=1610747 RepID=UPI0035C981DD